MSDHSRTPHPSPRRRLLFAAVAVVVCGAAAAADATAPARSLLVAGFELIEDHPNPAHAQALQRRLLAAREQLEAGLAERGLYRVIHDERAAAEIARLRDQHSYLYRCNGCPQQIGRAAGVDLVAMGWVQKVSELILNLNVELHETASGRVVLTKSVDLRGDNDESWRRGVQFMLRDWAERRARNPAYGV